MKMAFFLLCFLGTTPTLEQPEWFLWQSDLEKLGFKVPVLSITQRVYQASKLKGTIRKRHLMLDPLANWDLTFNKKGFITKKTCYGAANEVIFYYDYKYKRKNQLVRKTMYDHRDYRMEQVDYIYNNLGQLAAESIYRSDLSLLVRYVYNYSVRGKLERTDVHAPTPGVYSSARYEFEYNKAGQMTEQRTYNLQEQLQQSDHYTYDKNGFLKVHVIKNHLDNFVFESHSRHDEQGNLMTFQAPAEKEPSTSYTYTFDDSGNWVSRTHYKKGKVQDILERTIVYATPAKEAKNQ